jgi:hypothetical protein
MDLLLHSYIKQINLKLNPTIKILMTIKIKKYINKYITNKDYQNLNKVNLLMKKIIMM